MGPHERLGLKAHKNFELEMCFLTNKDFHDTIQNNNESMITIFSYMDMNERFKNVFSIGNEIINDDIFLSTDNIYTTIFLIKKIIHFISSGR